MNSTPMMWTVSDELTESGASSRSKRSGVAHGFWARAAILAVSFAGCLRPCDAQELFLERQELFASNGWVRDLFGAAVSLDADVAAVGAPEADSQQTNSGAAYVLRHDGTHWLEERILRPKDRVDQGRFGSSIDVLGDRVVVGAPGADGASAGSGAVYLYRYDGSQWSLEQKLVATQGVTGDGFGCAVSLDADRLLVGSPWKSCAGQPLSGAVYAFDFDGTAWVETQVLLPTVPTEGTEFGFTLEVDRGFLAIGSRPLHDPTPTTGSIWMFEHDGAQWTESATWTSPDGADGDLFGCSLSLDGTLLAVGAPSNDDAEDDAGTAHLFRFDGAQWNWEAKLVVADAQPGDALGFSVSVFEGTVVVGAYRHGALDKGAVYVFENGSAGWVESQVLQPQQGQEVDWFGCAVALGEKGLIAGAENRDVGVGLEGAGFAFQRPSLTLDISPPVVTSGDSVDIDTCGGVPDNQAALFLIGIDAQPHVFLIAMNKLGGGGDWNLNFTVPPGLSGLDLSLQSYSLSGESNAGSVLASAPAQLLVQ